MSDGRDAVLPGEQLGLRVEVVVALRLLALELRGQFLFAGAALAVRTRFAPDFAAQLLRAALVDGRPPVFVVAPVEADVADRPGGGGESRHVALQLGFVDAAEPEAEFAEELHGFVPGCAIDPARVTELDHDR